MAEALQILIIDDDENDRELCKRFFPGGYKVWEAETGDAGLAMYLANQIDCVLLDYSLPAKDGLQVLSELGKIDTYAPVVMMTGQGDERLAVEAMKRGAQDYLVKGQVSSDNLCRAILNAKEKTILQRSLAKSNRDLAEANQQLEKALRELQQAQQTIIQQERMSALGKMASGIAHDFNNALSPMIGFIELLLDVCPHFLDDKEKVKRYLALMKKSAEDAAEVVRRMREFYRPQEERHQPIQLDQLVDEVRVLTQPRWKNQALSNGKTIEYIQQLDKVPAIMGNESELRELLLNLIFNSVEAIEKQGKISLFVYAQSDKVFLRVEDTGQGMSEEVVNRCFEPFFSTKEGRGSGLGLSMVYGIIQRHQGIIDITSMIGRGTVITIYFPLKGKTAIGPQTEERLAMSNRKFRILLVDDELLNRNFLSELLQAGGHIVTTAVDGKEALDIFKKDCFDLVITDLSMPNMRGDTFASEIKKLRPQLPVIMLTGFGDIIKDISERPDLVDIVLSKPLHTRDLQEAMAKIQIMKE